MIAPDRKLTARYKSIAEEILRLEAEDVARSGDPDDEVTSKPRPPANSAAIAKAEKARKRTFSSAYRTFLLTFDGWEDFSWGTQLYGTKDLASSEYEEIDELADDIDVELEEDLQGALTIGWSVNDAQRILLLDDGAVVDWLYEERTRYPDLGAYLQSHKKALEDVAEAAAKARRTTEAEWDPKRRAADAKALEAELTKVLASAKEPPRPRPIKVTGRAPAAVRPSELVARKGKTIVAEVGLGLVLYLGAAPSKDEVVGVFRAFRRHFPASGKLEWAPAEAMTFSKNEEKSADSEALFERLRVDDQGHFGLRANVVPKGKKPSSKNVYWINIRGVPPGSIEDDAEVARASFIEVFVPHDESAEALAAFARDVLDIVPVVRSGHGGWFAHVWDDEVEPNPWKTVFGWCRRHFGVEPAQVDGWLVATRRRARGAGWLTILGRPFARALDKRLAKLPRSVVREDRAHGTILRAGASPSLGDVARGDFPSDIGAVARAIAPVAVGAYARSGMLTIGGRMFTTFTDELVGFDDHHATALHLGRFVDPQAFLGPTPREEAEALLAKVCAATKNPKPLREWTQSVKKGEDSFRDLLSTLAAAAHPLITKPLGVEALELVTRDPGWAPHASFGNLLYSYLHFKRYEDGLAVMEAVLDEAKSNPTTYHNAACIYALTGHLDRALECTKLAKTAGYDGLAKMKDDPELGPLMVGKYKKPFLALFA